MWQVLYLMEFTTAARYLPSPTYLHLPSNISRNPSIWTFLIGTLHMHEPRAALPATAAKTQCRALRSYKMDNSQCFLRGVQPSSATNVLQVSEKKCGEIILLGKTALLWTPFALDIMHSVPGELDWDLASERFVESRRLTVYRLTCESRGGPSRFS